MIRALIAERTDPVLFELSYDYVGDLSETVALMWPADPTAPAEQRAPSLTAVVDDARPRSAKPQLPAQLARWLDALDETGRWALLKLVTGALRIGVSARLAKTAAAALGDKDVQEIELIWPGLTPPYAELFAWLEGRADKPDSRDPAPFRPAMLAHAIEDGRSCRARSRPTSSRSGNGTASACRRSPARADDGAAAARLYSRTGEDISRSFPDLVDALRLAGRDRRRAC